MAKSKKTLGIIIVAVVIIVFLIFFFLEREKSKLSQIAFSERLTDAMEDVQRKFAKENYEQEHPIISINGEPNRWVKVTNDALTKQSLQGSFAYSSGCKRDTDVCWVTVLDIKNNVSVDIPYFTNFVWVDEDYIVGFQPAFGDPEGLYVVDLDQVKNGKGAEMFFAADDNRSDARSMYFKDINIENSVVYFSVVYRDTNEIDKYSYDLDSKNLKKL